MTECVNWSQRLIKIVYYFESSFLFPANFFSKDSEISP